MSNRGYSVDLRERVLAAVDNGMTHPEAAETFSIGQASVDRWVRLRRETGSLEPRPHGGGYPAAFDDEQREIVRQVVAEKPDRTLAELTVEVCARIKRTVSASAIVRAVKKLGLTLKKRSSPRSRKNDRTYKSATKSSSPK
jgi:transposase